MYRILAINPGSTSTKIALFEDENKVLTKNLPHSTAELSSYAKTLDQYPFRLHAIQTMLEETKISLDSIDAFVGRGGLLFPIPSGTYLVEDVMLEDLVAGVQGEHASNLGGILAHRLATFFSKPAFIVDPVVVDELQDLARFSGHPDLQRRSIFHALNHKAVGRRAAESLGKTYAQTNLVIAHLGGGISVAAHKHGQVVDVNNALDGDGPFSPERSGTLPAGDLVRLCFAGTQSRDAILCMIKGKGGVVAYTGCNDMQEIEKRIAKGDQQAETVYRAMAYQVAKEIGAQVTVLKGQVDAIVLTGGIAYDKNFVSWIKEYCQYLAPVLVFPGEEEMGALALGALRVLRKEEAVKHYRHNVES